MKHHLRKSASTSGWARCAGLLAVLSAAACYAVYRHYVPPVHQPDKKVYPYALLLGCPSHKDGTMSTSQKARCDLAVQAWKQHAYQTLVISGAAVRHGYVESEEMAKYIHKKCDVPVMLEKEARNTWQNLENTRNMIGDQPVLIITGSLHGGRASAMASNFFSDYALLCYPDRKPRHIVREIISRLIYIRIEMQKDLARLQHIWQSEQNVFHFAFKGPRLSSGSES